MVAVRFLTFAEIESVAPRQLLIAKSSTSRCRALSGNRTLASPPSSRSCSGPSWNG